jgi:type IV pilus assembly protein PilV
MTPRIRSATPQCGFSLLEVLITIVVMGTALLGTAALQAYSIKVSQGGQFRTQAIILATDLIERLDANAIAAAAGAYEATLPSAAATGDCAANDCDAQQMAAYDLARFQERLQAALPEGAAKITRAGTGPWIYTVQVTWKERGYRQKSSTSSLTGSTETFSYTVTRRINDPATVS